MTSVDKTEEKKKRQGKKKTLFTNGNAISLGVDQDTM